MTATTMMSYNGDPKQWGAHHNDFNSGGYLVPPGGHTWITPQPYHVQPIIPWPGQPQPVPMPNSIMPGSIEFTPYPATPPAPQPLPKIVLVPAKDPRVDELKKKVAELEKQIQKLSPTVEIETKEDDAPAQGERKRVVEP